MTETNKANTSNSLSYVTRGRCGRWLRRPVAERIALLEVWIEGIEAGLWRYRATPTLYNRERATASALRTELTTLLRKGREK